MAATKISPGYVPLPDGRGSDEIPRDLRRFQAVVIKSPLIVLSALPPSTARGGRG
jgi:hypothetical protein